MQQQRFVLALVISAAILFAWSYFFPPQVPPQNQNKNVSATASPKPPHTSAAALAQSAPTADAPQLANLASDSQNAPQRTITISSPLYEVRLDSLGGVATSWILKKNKDTNRPLHSVAGDKRNPQPLQLISQEGLKQTPREAPFRLITGDANTDNLLASRNYRIGGDVSDQGDINLTLAPGEQKRVEFTLHDQTIGLDVIKTVDFFADNYHVELGVNVKHKDQLVPAKISIGPSIGDQGVSHYSFYAIAPEGVAVAADRVHRINPLEVHNTRKNGGLFNWIAESLGLKSPETKLADSEIVDGAVDWAGVADTYFAMVAVPFKKTEGLEYRTIKYTHEVDGKKDERFLITAYVPLSSDGAPIKVYMGPKDHYLLKEASAGIGQAVGRTIDLEGLVNYGFLESIRRPLAAPILWCIKQLYNLTGSYGVAIILFTIFIYSLFFPLKWRSSKAMKKAQKLAPRMKELQEKIKGMKQNDPRLKDLQMEQLRLMREGNPLGGCLPVLIQFPFLFALYSAITISIDFRQASFLWIPDLSAAEPYFIHVLPILMAGSMVFLQLITPAPSADPLQRKMMAIGMPLFMLYMFWNVPAGLVVYWLVGNLVGFGQQLLINRLTKSEDDEEPPAKDKKNPRAPNKLSPAQAS